MKKDIQLEADGFQILFEITEDRQEFFQAQITLTYQTDSNRGSLQLPNELLGKTDLLRLVEYYETHISNLKSNRDYESETFAAYDLPFQTQAFCGEIGDKLDGDFSISFMLNIGRSKEGTSVYVGCEGTITVESAKQFIDSFLRIF